MIAEKQEALAELRAKTRYLFLFNLAEKLEALAEPRKYKIIIISKNNENVFFYLSGSV